MARTVYFKLKCPKCFSPAHAEMDKNVYKFLIYKCPVCDSNVVYYDNKVDILSDEFVRKFSRDSNVVHCGEALFPRISPSNGKTSDEEITRDRIVDLKILLNTESSLDNLLLKI